MERRDPIDRVVDFAFGVPAAGVMFARELTKIATHQLASSLRDAGAELAVRATDRRATASQSVLRAEPPASVPAPSRSDANDDGDRADTVSDPIEIVDIVIDTVDLDGAGSDGAGSGGAGSDGGGASLEELPVEGYEHLSARQIMGLLADLSELELTEIERFERSGRGRRTVLGRIEQIRSERESR